MVLSIVSLLFFALAAICNSMMDTLQFHWYKFRWNNNVNDKWWNPSISWKNKYIDNDPSKELKFKFPFGGLSNFLDAWHFFKMTSIFFMVFAILTFPFSNQITFFDSYFWSQTIWCCMFGAAWIFPFNLFFNKIFVVNKK